MELSDLDPWDGFRIDGESVGDEFGRSVSNAGDVNGDGFDDIIIGAPHAGPGYAGASYVVFGTDEGFPVTLELAALDGSNGFVIESTGPVDRMGRSVSTAGDINGDDFDDLIIGAPFSGSCFVVFGTDSFAPTLDVSELDGTDGFRINGNGNSSSVSSAGDINGDGFDDLLIGSPGGGSAGSAFVIFGSSGGFAPTFELSSIYYYDANGFLFVDTPSSPAPRMGASVSNVGDMNGDGFDDIVIGAPGDGGPSAAYVVFGTDAGFPTTFDLTTLDGSNGFRIYRPLTGVGTAISLGFSVSGAGDVNGDGYADIIIGAPYADPDGIRNSGASYVIFGSSTPFSPTLDLMTLYGATPYGANGFQIDGAREHELSGSSVSGAGDFNGDGFDDLIVGAPRGYTDGVRTGSAYVIFGSDTFAATFDLSSLNKENGFRIDGVAGGDETGFSVSAAGDINGDGFDDLIVGAPATIYSSPDTPGSGYVIFGRASMFATIDGTSGNDSLIGTADDDVISGFGGADTLLGEPGEDTLYGGDGNDSLSGGDDEDVLEGGADDDALDGGGDDDALNGGSGNDSLTGNSGNDNVIGADGDDSLQGNVGDDTLQGGSGNDTLEGGAGHDSAIFSGASSSYSITRGAGGIVVVSGPDGTDNLAAIERLVFSDTTIMSHVPGPDFNGDGRTDIVWQNYDGRPAMWLMSGTSLIGDAVVGNPGPDWNVKGAGDFNGDGKSDILWQHDNGQAAVWLFNGTTQIGAYFVGSDPGPDWHVKDAADFNGDGKSDILWQHDDGRAAVWLLDGATQIDTAVVGGNPGSDWHVKDTADFNGDGKADILWQTNDGLVAVWLLDGVTQIGDAVVDANPGIDWRVKGTGDFNKDGHADILVQNKISGQPALWYMNGTTKTAAYTLYTPSQDREIAGIGDFDKDGFADILWQQDDGRAVLWLKANNPSNSNLANPGTDWLIANSGSVNLDSLPYDFDGNGWTDLLWQNTSGRASVWLVDGTTHIGGADLIPNPGPAWTVIGSGDFNGDDRADILWQHTNGEASIWLMNGASRLSGAGLSPNPGPAWNVIGSGDFNNDGKSDILWQNDNGSAAIWFMNGTSRIGGTELATNPGPSWHAKGSGDFNGDGKADILWQHDDGRADVWLMNGTAKLADAVVGSNPGPAWHVIGAADFNGDGKSDILWQNDDGRAGVWLMNGTQFVSGAPIGSNPGPEWEVIGAGDFDGDARSDILWQNDDGQAMVWFVDGLDFGDEALLGVARGSDWHLAWA